MSDSSGPDRMEVGGREEFNRGLARLRSRGATALVTGTAGPVGFHRISGHLLGDIESSRVPLYVLVGRTWETIRERTRHPAAVNEFQVVESTGDSTDANGTHGRGLRAPDAENAPTPDEASPTGKYTDRYTRSGRTPDTTDPNVLWEKIADAVEVTIQRYRLGDWDLRVTVDSCIPLLEHNELDAVTGFFDRIRGLMFEHTGFAHAVYQTELNSQNISINDGSTDDLLDAFDLHIRVREQRGRYETQWELLDSDCRTAWLELPPAHRTLP